jgi:hypothetical protein
MCVYQERSFSQLHLKDSLDETYNTVGPFKLSVNELENPLNLDIEQVCNLIPGLIS